MMRVRTYLPTECWDRSPLQLDRREAHHLIHVLRVRPGMEVVCFNGQGGEAVAEITKVTSRSVTLSFKERRQAGTPRSCVDLAVAVPKHGRIEQIVDQATQLGVGRIIPLSCARSVVRIDPHRWAKKRERLRQIAVEACKQSTQSFLPAIDPLTRWPEILPRMTPYDLCLLAAVKGPHEDLSALVRPSARKLLLLIGPEGDFTEEEVREACRAGAHRISLGPAVLRVETAAVAALSILNFLLRGEFSLSHP